MMVSDDQPHILLDYRRELHRRARRRQFVKRGTWLGAWLAAGVLVLGLTFHTSSWISASLEEGQVPFLFRSVNEQPKPKPFTRDDLRTVLDQSRLTEAFWVKGARVEGPEGSLTIETSIDRNLQDFVTTLLNRSLTQHSAAVVIRPDNGQILAMASFENSQNEGSGKNLCVRADFPAASLFKIIAAAAAIEARGMNPDTPLVFRGPKYTLYKSQLKEEKGKKGKKPGTETTLCQAFSDSINPVFGKLGIHHLGNELISDYARRFLFNQTIPFDFSVSASQYVKPMDDYALAEVASGFNKRTFVSPLHAALITASIANEGIMMTPWLIQSVRDDAGKVLYRAVPSVLAKPINKKTAGKMMVLMEGTVEKGTCKKAFRPLQHKRELKYVDLGAKTGTINGPVDHYKYEWLTAFALPSGGDGGLCITVMTAHGEKMGVRAKDIARLIINHHYAS